MRALLDTNIFIYREDDAVLSGELQEAIKTANEVGISLLLHPHSIKELEKDSDEGRKEIVLSKVQTYPTLDNPPDVNSDSNFVTKVGSPSNSNDAADNSILFALYRDSVDFLITEDRGIHRKAQKCGVSDRCLLIDEASKLFKSYLSKEHLSHPSPIAHDSVHNLDIDDPIFDSLKNDYPEFGSWFKKICKQGRKCWKYNRPDGSLGAILIYKEEDEEIALESKSPLRKKKRLKLCAMKVTHIGFKLGELFIKLCVDYAGKNNISEMYLTHFTDDENDHLIPLITEFGFEKVGTNQRGEEVYVKRLFYDPSLPRVPSPLEVTRKYHPSFRDGAVISKFMVPIQPKYHDRLFRCWDGKGEQQTTLGEFAGALIIEGNTIKKSYLSHSKIKRMKAGDLVIFYRSMDGLLTSLGVIEEVYCEVTDPQFILRKVGKRSVYSKDEIEKMTESPVLVLLFRHHFHFNTPPSLQDLKDNHIIKGPPQSITEISEEAYRKIKNLGGIDERFVVH